MPGSSHTRDARYSQSRTSNHARLAHCYQWPRKLFTQAQRENYCLWYFENGEATLYRSEDGTDAARIKEHQVIICDPGWRITFDAANIEMNRVAFNLTTHVSGHLQPSWQHLFGQAIGPILAPIGLKVAATLWIESADGANATSLSF